MSRSGWRSYSEAGRVIVGAAVLAVALTVLVILPHSSGRPNAEEPNQAGQRGATQENWQPHFSPREPYAPYQNTNCQSPQDREEADLCQQWRMAEATEKAVALADSQFWWNVVQVISTVLAAFATACAAWAAATASRSAQRSIEHSEQVSKLELRPYVFCEQFRTSPNVASSNPTVVTGWLLELEWKNYGHTPATNVRAHLNHQEFEIGRTPEITDFPDLGTVSEGRQTLGPQQNFFSRRFIPVDEVIRVYRGTSQVIYWGWIEYSGLDLSVRHRTEICAILLPQIDPTKLDCHFRNAWCTDFNATDDDCVHKPNTGGPLSKASPT